MGSGSELDSKDEEVEVVRDTQSAGSRMSQFYRSLSSSTYLSEQLSEVFKMAEIAMAMVPGSAEDERRSSALSFVKSDVRNGLDVHLGPCLRLFSQRCSRLCPSLMRRP